MGMCVCLGMHIIVLAPFGVVSACACVFHNLCACVFVQADARHAYYCVGAVWRSVMKHFARRSRITDVIQQMFLSKEAALKFNLPIEEVSSR